MKKIILLVCCCIIFFSYKTKELFKENDDLLFANAAMPSLAKDKNEALHIVFARGNGLFYAASVDKGATFSEAVLVDSISGLVAGAGRGPQITCTKNGINVLALDREGNIYSYTKEQHERWIKNGKVNDVPDIAKEGFLSVAAKDDSLYAVWLDLRSDAKNKIVGALSDNGGKTWQKNKIVYQSPTGTVCECCKPSVVFGANGIIVMFRNNLDNDRDLYIIQSTDGGNSFSSATKLGNGSWKLNACPMDGGGLTYNNTGTLQTVWRRKDTIYSSTPGAHEQMIGKGKNCSIENVDGHFVYAWIEDGNIICLLPGKQKKEIGKGIFPIIKSTGDKEFICVWQQNNNIYRRLISL